MTSYTAPVEDMMFLFEKLRDNKNYNELEKYKEVSSDLVKNILMLKFLKMEDGIFRILKVLKILKKN